MTKTFEKIREIELLIDRLIEEAQSVGMLSYMTEDVTPEYRVMEATREQLIALVYKL